MKEGSDFLDHFFVSESVKNHPSPSWFSNGPLLIHEFNYMMQDDKIWNQKLIPEFTTILKPELNIEWLQILAPN